jgi:hypothetical protein
MIFKIVSAIILFFIPLTVNSMEIKTAEELKAKLTFAGNTICVVLLDSGTWELDEDVVVPKNVEIKVESGVKISVSPGHSLVFYGTFHGPKELIFNHGGILLFHNPTQYLFPEWWGAKGNGISDDTVPFQQTLTIASESNSSNTIVISKNSSYRITDNLYVYNKVNLNGEVSKEGSEATIILDAIPSNFKYWFNFGISMMGDDVAGHRYSGKVQNVTISGSEKASTGRLLFYHNAQDYSLVDCTINLTKIKNNTDYLSAIGGANDNPWCKYSYRKNGLFKSNQIIAAQNFKSGGEGIGQGNGKNIRVLSNTVYGMGDDPIGMHDIDGGVITGNHVSSPDGRILLNNCRNFNVIDNNVVRIPDLSTGKYAGGIALIYLGHENLTANNFSTPTNIVVSGNRLYYPPGNNDEGYAIYLRGARTVVVENNKITNDNDHPNYGGIHIEPFTFNGKWNDPDGIDTDNTARPSKIVIRMNVLDGKFPLSINQTGKIGLYRDPVVVEDNQASAFHLYFEKSVVRGNTVL